MPWLAHHAPCPGDAGHPPRRSPQGPWRPASGGTRHAGRHRCQAQHPVPGREHGQPPPTAGKRPQGPAGSLRLARDASPGECSPRLSPGSAGRPCRLTARCTCTRSRRSARPPRAATSWSRPGPDRGKTECFLLPVLAELIAEHAAGTLGPGVRALLLYPMNALANDQVPRLRQVLAGSVYPASCSAARRCATARRTCCSPTTRCLSTCCCARRTSSCSRASTAAATGGSSCAPTQAVRRALRVA
jgi:hypothetical protein